MARPHNVRALPLRLAFERAPSCGNLFVRKLRRSSPLGSMLDRDRANVPLGVNVEQRIFVKITSFRHRCVSKFDEQRIGLSEVANLHGTNLRSKKALWTVTARAGCLRRESRFITVDPSDRDAA